MSVTTEEYGRYLAAQIERLHRKAKAFDATKARLKESIRGSIAEACGVEWFIKDLLKWMDDELEGRGHDPL